MSFIGINEQNKQRINISKEAALIIEQDIKDFNLGNKNVLINNLVSYIEENNLTKEAELNAYKKALLSDYEKVSLDLEKERLADQLCELRKNEMIRELSLTGTHRRNQFGFYFRISNNVRRWLESPSNTEDEFYLSLEHFLNCIIEEYATYDYSLRESIACKERISAINHCISNNQWIDIYSAEEFLYRIYPVRVSPDTNRTHIYLAAISKKNENEYLPVTFRISAFDFNSIRPVYNLPPCDKKHIVELDSLIMERGIQFLSLPAKEIKVQLNAYGVKTYNRTKNLRPFCTNITANSDGTYTYKFLCTEKQAEYYFMGFGSNAEILSPASLREIFKDNYYYAYQRYCN